MKDTQEDKVARYLGRWSIELLEQQRRCSAARTHDLTTCNFRDFPGTCSQSRHLILHDPGRSIPGGHAGTVGYKTINDLLPG